MIHDVFIGVGIGYRCTPSYAEERAKANKRGNPWDPVDVVRTQGGVAGGGVRGAEGTEGTEGGEGEMRLGSSVAGAARTDPFASSTATLAEEAANERAETEERDKWVEGTTGGPVVGTGGRPVLFVARESTRM